MIAKDYRKKASALSKTKNKKIRRIPSFAQRNSGASTDGVSVRIGENLYKVGVVSASDTRILETPMISENDREMDIRAKQAVKAAIAEAKEKDIPVGRYDKQRKMAYLEYADGKRVYAQ